MNGELALKRAECVQRERLQIKDKTILKGQGGAGAETGQVAFHLA